MSLNVYNLFISIPEKDCWLDKDSVVNTIKNYINNWHKKNIIVLFCASMATNAMIDELYNWNYKHTYLDMGSVFDPYVGVAKRSYHNKIIERENNKWWLPLVTLK